jgi:threonyl-tRNA synthetase
MNTDEKRNPYTVLVGKREEKKQIASLRQRHEDSIKADLK